MLIISTHDPTITCICWWDPRSISIDKRISFRVSPKKKQKHFPASLIFLSIRPEKRVRSPIFSVLTFLFFSVFSFSTRPRCMQTRNLGNRGSFSTWRQKHYKAFAFRSYQFLEVSLSLHCVIFFFFWRGYHFPLSDSLFPPRLWVR